MPDGRPAVKARIAFGIAGAQISIMNGDFLETSTFCAIVETGDSGELRFPAPQAAFQLVVVHPSGFAHISATPDNVPAKIELEAWARVEGTFRVGKTPVADALLTINTKRVNSHGNEGPRISTQHEVTTAEDGRFVFERVIPGSARMGRNIIMMVREGATEVTSTSLTAVNLPAGKTKHINLGGTGRPIIGKLQPPEGFAGEPRWNFALVWVGPDLPVQKAVPVPAAIEADPKKRAAWWRTWEQTPEGKAWMVVNDEVDRLRETSPIFRASVDRDGTFRIDDMPPGSYTLSVQRDHRLNLGSLPDYRFSIEPMEGDRSDLPLDLGDLMLEK